jgi:hypothetical protein
MPQLEPNLVALGWFCLLWSVCCVGFLQLVGMYPLRRGLRLPVIAATAVWLAVFAGAIGFAAIELRWTSVVVVGGVLLLFLPALFEGRSGLQIAGCVMIAALALLAHLAAPSFHAWFT